MSKTSVFTTCTPLPAGITRQSVLDMYHAHTEMIDLNPLVIERFECKAPNYAPAEEYYSTWYTIKDKVNYGIGSSSVSYHACFHDLPDGLQTHVYAPLGLDIRAKWSVGGSLPGEPKAPQELGIGAPREGIYIREDVRMKCNIMMMGFVKKTFKESHAKMVDKLAEKAREADVNRQANERLTDLKNVAPGERMGHGSIYIAPPPGYKEDLANEDRSELPPQPHSSMYSDGSANSEPSPALSQASTLTSPSEVSQNSNSPQPYRYYHQRSQTEAEPARLGPTPGQSQRNTMASQSQFPQNPPQQYRPYQHQRSQTQDEPFRIEPLRIKRMTLANPPQQQYTSAPLHTHTEDCDHRGSFRFEFDQRSPGQPSPAQPSPLPQPQSLPTLSYLPSTVYNPNPNSNRGVSQYNAYDPSRSSGIPQPSRAELPAHMQDSPTLPLEFRNERDDSIAELPA